MSSYYFYLYSSLINALSAAFFGLYVYLKNKKKLVNRSFALMSIFVTVWGVGLFLCHLTKDRNLAVYFNRFLVHGGAIFIPVAHLRFILISLEKWREKRKTFFIILVSSFLLFSFAFSPLLIKEMKINSFYRFWPSPGPIYPLFLIHFMGLVVYSAYLLLKKYPQETGFRRNQIKYMLLSILIGFGGGSTNYFLFYNIPIHPLGHPLVSLYPLLLGYAVARYRLMDIDIIINKTILYLSLLGIFLCIHTIFIKFLSPFVGEFQVTIFSIALVMAIFLSPLREKMGRVIDDLIYRGKYNYQKILKESTKVLMNQISLQQILDSFVKIIAENLEISKASLFLEDEGTGDYMLRSSFGLKSIKTPLKLKAQSDTILWLKEKKTPFVREELERLLSEDSFRNVYNGLFKIRAEVVIPIFYKDDLLGLLVLDNKKSNQMYTQLDLEILSSVIGEVSIAIENARLYQKIIIDQLTGFYNYNYLEKRLSEEMERIERKFCPLALVAMELDYLEIYSRSEKAKIIKNISSIIRKNIRNVDIPFYSEEKFFILFPDSTRTEVENNSQRLFSYFRGMSFIGERLKIKVRRLAPVDLFMGGIVITGKDRRIESKEMIAKACQCLENAKNSEAHIEILCGNKEIGAFLESLSQGEILTFGSIKIDTEAHNVFLEDKPLELTPKEFDLLCYLIKKKGRLLTRVALMDNIWGYKYMGTTHTVDVHVARLRRKLGPLGKMIKTVEGLGYQLVCPEEETA